MTNRNRVISLLRPQVRPLNVDGSLNLLGLETVRLIYFRNKMAGKNSQVHRVKHHKEQNSAGPCLIGFSNL